MSPLVLGDGPSSQEAAAALWPARPAGVGGQHQESETSGLRPSLSGEAALQLGPK